AARAGAGAGGRAAGGVLHVPLRHVARGRRARGAGRGRDVGADGSALGRGLGAVPHSRDGQVGGDVVRLGLAARPADGDGRSNPPVATTRFTGGSSTCPIAPARPPSRSSGRDSSWP